MMRYLHFTLWGALLLAFSCAPKQTLFEDGRSEYSIVVGEDATLIEQYAAQELQTWIREVSGAELPLVADAQPGKRLILTCEEPEGRDDAFVYANDGGDIRFTGKGPRGTLYAVYAFLENELGCRWYSAKVSVAPRRDSWSFRKLHCQEAPGIRIRDNCYLDPRTKPVFSARLRNNFVRIPSPDGEGTIPGSAEGYWGVHALGTHVPVGKYFKTHPEYFCLRDGKRYGGYGQPCLSNPEVLAITIESVRKVMLEEPDYLIYSVEQNDNQLFCQCEDCQALSQMYGGESGVMIWFVNQVADAVREEFPDKFIGTFAYQYTRHAPTGIRPRENVVVRLCSIECCLMHGYDECEQNQSFLQDLREWGEIAPHLYIWDYVTDFAQYCVPVANWKTLQPHIRDFRDNHAIGILEEGDYQTVSCELREMRTWLLSKLMWNPDADMDALILDFTDGYYGPAGRYIRDYLDLEERILRRPGVHGNCYVHPSDSMFTDEFIQEGRRIFADAKEAVAGQQDLYNRVETAEMPLCFLQMVKNPLLGFQEGADDLVRRVVEREGMSRLAEGAWAGGMMSAKELLAYYEQIREEIDKGIVLPAVAVNPTEKGVEYVRYEGDFMSTAEMLDRGTEVERGTASYIGLTEAQEKDHFGYVYKGWLEASKEGLYQFRITSDDGTVLLLDGKPVLDLDGSHSPVSAFCFVRLEKGFHSFELRYFEDCEGQILEGSLMGPAEPLVPLCDWKLYH
ncbi:MAG: DUF4838 domain-containing protein [Bacteroidales bacterium]|nr:DUF4838 domain-containing protein [Bacteroidales bacterium]